ncbi:DUF6801 domain-containing protein [Nocardioides gilvus]|uniref:DUF6801 domain-containing protein n=1 Tax=Nocardioides gilvus TaxID=1735589 RepID=UPI0013A52CC2|nr:DUF6801 domain-containing protein [Nocardioides gilvus]
MSSFTPSRRSVLRTAAWSAPVVAVAAAAPAFATSGASFTTITTEPLPFAAAIPGVVDLGVWTVTLTSEVPVNLPVGTVVPAPELTAVITVPNSARNTIAFFGVTEVSGTASAPYTVQGQPAPLPATVTIPLTTVPASGDMVITTTGPGTSFTADAAGTFTISLEDIVADLSLGSLGEQTANLTRQPGTNYTIATFTVA